MKKPSRLAFQLELKPRSDQHRGAHTQRRRDGRLVLDLAQRLLRLFGGAGEYLHENYHELLRDAAASHVSGCCS